MDVQQPRFRLEVFEGPLDLLLSLIEKNKVDIRDIPIALIFDQYMEYIDAMRALDMEIAGEFIVCAAELMLIKSRVLLPKPADGEEEDPRAALAAALIEYKRAKAAAGRLAELYSLHAGRFAREADVPAPSNEPPEGLDVSLLTRAFTRMLEKKRELPQLAMRSEKTLESLLSGRTVTVAERIIWVMRRMYGEGEKSLDDLLYACRSRSELVATFMAVLELLRGQRVSMSEGDNGDIFLKLNLSHLRQTESASDGSGLFYEPDGNDKTAATRGDI